MEEIRNEFEEARQTLKDLLALREHPGWGLLVKAWETQIEQRKEELFKPLEGLDGAFERQLLHGELGGISMAASLLDTLIESAEYTEKLLRAQLQEMEHGTGTEDESDFGPDESEWPDLGRNPR